MNAPATPTRKPRTKVVGGETLDFDSPEWQGIRHMVAERLDDVRKRIARPMIDEREADTLRGEAKLCEAILDLDDERPTIPSDIYK